MSFYRETITGRRGRRVDDSVQRDAQEEANEPEEGDDSEEEAGSDIGLQNPKRGQQLMRRYVFVTITVILMIVDLLLMIAIGIFYGKMIVSSFLVSLTIHSKTSFNSDNVYTEGPSVRLGGVLLSLSIMSFLLKFVQVFEVLSETLSGSSEPSTAKGRIWRVMRVSKMLIDNGLHFQTIIFNGMLIGISSTFVLVSSGLGVIDNVIPCACMVTAGCFFFCCAVVSRSLELKMENELDIYELLKNDSNEREDDTNIPSFKVRLIVFAVKITCYFIGCAVFLSTIIINFTSVNTLNLGTLTLTKATLYFSFPVVTLIFQILFLLPLFIKMVGDMEWNVFELMHSIHMELYLCVITAMVIYGLLGTNTFDQISTLRLLLFGEP